jgi:beta-phosphoglucomutase-like phosphatase (HAD superfamily)
VKTGLDLRAVLFDVDGTLADTEEVHRSTFNQAFREHGLEWEWSRELYAELLAVTGGKERIRHYVARFHPDELSRTDLDAWIDQLHGDKTRLYRRQLEQEGLPLRPGVERLLEEARAKGLRRAIATTTSLENTLVLLSSTLGPRGSEWFEVIGAGDCVPAKKPAPDIYQWVLRELRLPPAVCLAVEDSANGLQASRSAGIPTLITVSAYTEGEHFLGAVAVISDLGEPEQPFRLIAGDAHRRRWVDVDLLRRWHADDAASRACFPPRALEL